MFFNQGAFDAALDCFNSALCYAPPESEKIPILYGSRATVFYMMGKLVHAINNIKLARENGFPASKSQLLDETENDCQKLLRELGPDSLFDASSFFKLSYPANKRIPFVAACLKLRIDDKYGRHIVTARKLKTGGLLLFILFQLIRLQAFKSGLF